jgi:hypothetical protein
MVNVKICFDFMSFLKICSGLTTGAADGSAGAAPAFQKIIRD